MKFVTEILLTFVLNAIWQIGLITMFAFVGAWLLRKSTARHRHAVWVSALVLSVLVPSLSCVSRIEEHLIQEKERTKIISTYQSEPALALTTVAPLPDSTLARLPEKKQSFLSTSFHVKESLALALLGLYAAICLYYAARLFRAWIRTRSIIKGGHSFQPGPQLRSVMTRCSRNARMNVRFLLSRSIAVPITAGVFRPVIILPEQLLLETDESVLTSAVGHEMVHVVRRDYLLNLIYELIFVLLAFHPAVRIVRRCIKRTRELCCDERVTAGLLNSQAYAQSLMRLIGAAPLVGRRAADTTIGVNESDNLEVRIMSLLKTRTSVPQWKSSILVAGALLLAIPSVAAARLALRFDVGQDNSTQLQQNLQRKQQEEAREELKRSALQLREQIQSAQDSQKSELQQRLREVERQLTEQERLMQQYGREAERSTVQAQVTQQMQEELAKARIMEDLRIREAQARVAQLRSQSSQLTAQQSAELQRAQRELEVAVQEQAQDNKQKEEKLKTKEREQREKQEWKEKEEREKQEFEEREKQEGGEGQVYTMRRREGAERERQERIELTRDATVPMDRAIQIATSQVPGKVLSCNLVRDEDKLFYHVIVVSADGDKSNTSYVWVSATDGHVMKTETEKPRTKEQEW